MGEAGAGGMGKAGAGGMDGSKGWGGSMGGLGGGGSDESDAGTAELVGGPDGSGMGVATNPAASKACPTLVGGVAEAGPSVASGGNGEGGEAN